MNDITLIENKNTYNLTVSDKLFGKITLYCAMNPHNEWSGVLFYKTKGSVDKDNLQLFAEDMVLLDVGTSGFTEFDMSPEVVSYIVDNPEIADCCTGLIHSHNTMATFFSGTDIGTLKEEGSERVNFLSLIVNNAQKYSAKYTQKVIREYDISYTDNVCVLDKLFKRKKVNRKETRTIVESWNLACVLPWQEEVDNMKAKQEEHDKKSIKQTTPSFGQLDAFDNWYSEPNISAATTVNTESYDKSSATHATAKTENETAAGDYDGDYAEQIAKFIVSGNYYAEESLHDCIVKTINKYKTDKVFQNTYDFMSDVVVETAITPLVEMGDEETLKAVVAMLKKWEYIDKTFMGSILKSIEGWTIIEE